MSDEQWIVVPNWERFQHYSDRTPPWIKLYLELNHKQEWLDLTDGARGLLVRIWLLTAASKGVLGVGQVRRQGWGKHSASHLASLNHAGFIHLSASKPLAQRREEKKTRARARARDGAPARDPHALEHLGALVDTIWKPIQ